MNDLLCVENICKTFSSGEETLHILNGVQLSLKSGQTMSITGESGSGKSTLLHILGGLDTTDSGKVCIDGVDITNLTKLHFQNFAIKKSVLYFSHIIYWKNLMQWKM